jgi:hypothetical protein
MAERPWFSLRILASRETARKYALWHAGKRLDPPNYEPGKPCSRLSAGPKIEITAPYSNPDLIYRKS